MSLNTCRQCNESLPQDAPFCPVCGTALVDVASVQAPPVVNQKLWISPEPAAAETTKPVLLLRQLNQPWFTHLCSYTKEFGAALVGCFLIVSVIAVFINLISGPTESEKQACDAVWTQYMDGMSQSMKVFADNTKKDGVDPWTRAHRAKVACYRNVDVSRCPREFRSAWIQYVAALAKESPADYFTVAGSTEDVSWETAAEMLETMRPLKEAEKKLSDAFIKYSPLAKSEMGKYADH